MTDTHRLVLQAMGSFVSEERLGRPQAALALALAAVEAEPERAAEHLTDACVAALLGGEPKRALRLLDRAHTSGDLPPRVAALVRAWAWQLDANRYPGDVGAEQLAGVEPVMLQPGNGTDELTLLEHVVAAGPPGMSTPRTLVGSLLRSGGDDTAAQIVRSVSQALGGLATRLESGPSGTGLWAHLARADLLHRLRDARAPEVLAAVVEGARQTGRGAALALAHLVEGDHLLTPGSSPECLGYSLAPEPRPAPARPAPDPAGALASYDAARSALGDLDAPRLAAALCLRRAMALGLAVPVDHDSRRGELRQAVARYEAAGDRMGAHLAAAHLLVADLDAGEIQGHALDLGAGWLPPTEGPVADALAWAAGDGSASWCVGIGRLLERAAETWVARGEVARARVAYLACLPLVQLNPALPARSIVTALANLDTRSNLATRALVRLERLTALPLGAGGDFDAAQRIEAATVTLGAHRARSRGAAAEYAARGMLRLRAQMADLASPGGGAAADPAQILAQLTEQAAGGEVDLEQILAGFGQLSALFDAGMAAVASELVATLDVLVPLARAEHAQRTGRAGDAGQWHTEAIERAGAPEAAAYLLPLAYVSADRLDDARTALQAAVADGSLPDDFVLPLSLRARDHALARQAANRLRADPAHVPDWPELLNLAELLRAEGREAEAAEAAERSVSAFEHLVEPLLRDPDRLAACDQPDVAGLYLTLALLRHRLGDDEASCEAFERGRSLSWGGPEETAADPALWRTWQRLAAEWGTYADRALVQIDREEGGLSGALVADLDQADGRLAVAEHDLERADPGVLLRRSAPAPGRLSDLRERLDGGTIVLEYAAMGDDLMGWAVTREGIQVVHHDLSYRRLATLVREFHRSCAAGRAAVDEPFSNLLLAPFADLLVGHARVVVVPFGPLNLLPFHALALDGVPLAVSHVVSYAPLAATVGRAGPLDEPLVTAAPLVVGDPAFAESAHPRLRRLEGARVEAQVVAATLQAPPDRVLLDDQAAETAVVGRLGSADLVHLATHGLLDELAPFASSLVLSGADELTVADLVGLQLTTPLAVLSGCDTGRGTATLGGDVVGLTRSLLRSGVRQAVVSLWPVDDRIAPVIMAAFYRHLVTGRPPAEALALAQRDLRGLSAADLDAAYVALGGGHETSGGARRRSAADLLLDPELRDDEPLPEPLDGSAERYWAPFVLVGE